jgi:hypothetical protein
MARDGPTNSDITLSSGGYIMISIYIYIYISITNAVMAQLTGPEME